uniref:Protein kinase domain-containing protein n=1 Tax=Oryzias latipes TaxID=8090 RepID=A0A3B3H3E5_ORYLA
FSSELKSRSKLYERFLGEGTFGKVAKCTNLSTNEEVAIKIIKNGFNDTAKDEIKVSSPPSLDALLSLVLHPNLN